MFSLGEERLSIVQEDFKVEKRSQLIHISFPHVGLNPSRKLDALKGKIWGGDTGKGVGGGEVGTQSGGMVSFTSQMLLQLLEGGKEKKDHRSYKGLYTLKSE